MIAKLASALGRLPRRWRSRVAALAGALCVALPGAALGEQDAAKRIRDELALVQQEQQAVFQQFQMVRELRNELLAPPAQQPALSGYGMGQPLPSYEDQVAAQKERDQKLTAYGQEMEQLYARYQELDGRRKYLIDELGQAGARR